MIPSSDFEVLFLGTGTSTGVPMIGCECPVCRSTDPHNRRLRSSLYLRLGDLYLLIDTAPDLREQALQHRLKRLDGVLFTHSHADHLFGLDDLRRFNTLQDNRAIPAYGTPETLDEIERIFNYLFGARQAGLYRAQIDLQRREEPFRVARLGALPDQTAPLITPIDVIHDRNRTVGYRIDYAGHALGYAPDCIEIPAAGVAQFKGVDVMIIDALRHRPHPTHMSIEMSVALLQQIAPQQGYLIHLCHDIDHATLAASLPPGIAPSYDGLRLRLGAADARS